MDGDDFTTPGPTNPTKADPVSVTLGARTFVLEAPASYTARVEVVEAGRRSWRRAGGAALGLCIRRLDRMLQILPYTGDLGTYGGAVVDGLVARGCAPEQVEAACLTAWRFVVDQHIPDSEVAATADFFGDKAKPTSLSSGSSAPGAASPDGLLD